MNRWLAARIKAHEVRIKIEASVGCELYGRDLVNAIIEKEEFVTCLERPADDPLLGNKDGGYDQARFDASVGLIVVSRDLPDEETKNVIKAHELGHRYVHTRRATCSTDDVDPTKLVLTLPYAEGRIATYHPRQMQESEATIFALELLVPSARLASLFDDGMSASELATAFQVPRYFILSQMTTVLLAPLIDFDELCAAFDAPVVRWRELDESQQKPCCESKGPVLVQAGPGTGKTQTLTSRVEWLIAERGIAPERILALTFSNRATEELRFRLHKTIPEHAHQVTVSTFHGFGLELLRRYSDEAGLKGNLQVIAPVEAEMLLEANLNELGLIHFSDPAIPNRFLDDILSEIARAKEELIDSDAYMNLVANMEQAAETEDDRENADKCREVGNVYRCYNELLRDKGLVDYGDLVMMPVHIFKDTPKLVVQLQNQYDYILVDEYQDINRANGELVRLIAGIAGEGLWAVGDLRQSIYRFRGASPAYIRGFKEYYPDAKVYPLQVNYRASQQLVRFAKRVAAQMNMSLPDPEWRSSRGSLTDSAILVPLATDKRAELTGIAESIEQFARDGVAYGDIAVLCRTNGQASEIARALSQSGISALHLGKFFFRREVKDLLAVLSFAVDGHGVTWPRVANLIRKPLSIRDAIKLWRGARENGRPFPQALTVDLGTELELAQLQQEDLGKLAAILTPYAVVNDPSPWLVLAEFLFEFGHYLRRLRSQAPFAKAQALLAVGQLLNLARAFRRHSPIGNETNSTRAFINHVRRLIERNDNDVDLPVNDIEIDAVHVLTVHKSKGLQFPIVFVPNLAKRRFPSSYRRRSSVPRVPGLEYDQEPDGDVLDEERCLFVAMTRAKNHLILSRAESYSRRTTKKPRNWQKSDLWRLLDQPLKDMGDVVIREDWTRSLDVDLLAERWQEQEPDFSADDNLRLEMQAVKVFQRCPRQFFYRYILGLSVPDEREVFLRFHIVVHRVASWIQRALAEGYTPDWEAVIAKLDEEFGQQIPADHVHARWYRKEADVRLRNLWDRLRETDRGAKIATFREPSAIDVQGVLLQFRLDEVLDFEDQRVVTHYKTGQAAKRHEKDPYLALSRKAASETTALPVRVRLNYLATGKTVNVDGAQDQKLVAELADDLRGIQRGHFPPEPRDNRFWLICAGCSYAFICPREEVVS